MWPEKSKKFAQPDFREAFQRNERLVRIRTGKLACLLTVVLMPLGVLLDMAVYPEHVGFFFKLRLLCSGLVAIVWALHYTRWGERHYRRIGLPIVFLPSLFIATMIACTADPAGSPYYAGLNLILLAVSAVGHWTLAESVISVVGVMEFYLLACFLQPTSINSSIFLNNLYFLILTGIIVIAGNYLYNQLLFSEFELRYELAENRRLLEENNRKLVELDKVKSRFFANISHELRTPLTLVLGPLEMLRRDSGSLPPPLVKSHLDTMWIHGLGLLKLINDLLDLVRLEEGKMELQLEPVQSASFVKGLVNSLQTAAEEKRITLKCDTEESVGCILIDQNKWERIILNLLYNSLKFTASGGQIMLSLRKAADQCVMEVSDNGIGISRDHLPFVFDRFWQADTSASRKFQGTGLGLALVRELVEVQGGGVSVESVLGQGTTFTITLPWRPAGPMPPKEKAPAGPSLSPERFNSVANRTHVTPSFDPATLRIETDLDPLRPSVLIADDEPDMLLFLKSMLTHRFQVIEAADGIQALDKASQFLPDVVILDMMMPEKDGLQVCRELRSRTPTRTIPILLVTARADEETKLAALGSGANDFVSKPFSTMELMVRAGNLAQSHQLQKKLTAQNRKLESTLEQLKEAQSQLVQREKLASLGRMSAGIIHEINNPLNYATTGAFNLRSFSGALPGAESEDFGDTLRDVTDGLRRIKEIVSDLRTFTHPDERRRNSEPVDGLVRKSLRLMSSEWRDKIKVTVEIPPALEIEVNGNQITQVLMNLIQNAIDSLRTHETPEPSVCIAAREKADQVLVSVRDNGPGISPENLGRVFDPFFTTKEVGAGMGLGLSICFSIMQQHEGRIVVESSAEGITEFTLAFPKKMRGSTLD